MYVCMHEQICVHIGCMNDSYYICIHVHARLQVHIPGAHEPRRRRGRSVQLLYKMLCQPLSNKLHKMPIYGQTLSKQGGGAKWLMIHKNFTTNRAQCTWSTSIVLT